MNPLAVCALLGLGCVAPPKHAHYEILGMVGGHAREVMQADWDSTANNPRAPERMYLITKDSTSAWQVGEDARDTIVVLYVLDVRRLVPRYADPLTIVPAEEPTGPTIHTHQNYCTLMTSWGPAYDSCSNTVPESHQCRPSVQDERTQALEGHMFDAVQCDRNAWAFYYAKELQS